MSVRCTWVLLICTAFSALWTLPASAQDVLWSRTYGGSYSEWGYSVQQTTDGGYIVAGRALSFSGGNYDDVYLVKTDSVGNTQWSRTYGGSDHDFGRCVQQTADGGYVVVGWTFSFGAGSRDVYLVKTDSLGGLLWSRTYGGDGWDYGYSVQQTPDGGYIVVGNTNSFGVGDRDVYLIKTNSGGDIVWTRTYGGSDNDWGYSVQQTSDGGYVAAGHTLSFGAGGLDVYLIKTDSTGDTLWTRTYGDSGGEAGWSAQQTIDGGYILTGGTNSFGAGESDAFLIKTDSGGDALWSRTYGGSKVDGGFSVHQMTDGGYVVAGWTETFVAGDSNVYLVRTDSLGDVLWSRTYGGDSYDYGQAIQQTMDGGYVVAGYTMSFGVGDRNVMLTKLDSSGNTCIGNFISPTVISVSCGFTSPSTEVTSPSTIVTSPSTVVRSPATQLTTVCERICGDVDGDGLIDLEDVVFLVHYLYMNGPAPEPPEAGNVNSDEIIDLADVVYLINYVLKGGSPPCC